MPEQLGRFGHHPDPAIDFEVEVDRLEGMHYEAQVGIADPAAFAQKLDRALSFRVGGVESCVVAKNSLRRMAGIAI